MAKQHDTLERRARALQDAAVELGTSLSTLVRARSHGLIRVVYFGRRPIIPAAEFERLARDGLPAIPPGYKRLTRGATKVGRPRKRKAGEAKTRPRAQRHASP